MLNFVINEIKKVINRLDFEKQFKWFIHKFELIDMSNAALRSKNFSQRKYKNTNFLMI